MKVRGGEAITYDLLVGAVGVNTNVLKHFESLDIGYHTPKTTKTYICEIILGEEAVHTCLGNAMHVFLLDLPRLEFAALIPKGEFATVCLLGEDIDKAPAPPTGQATATPEGMDCLPPDWEMPETYCHCSPMINISGAPQPYGDRVVMIGDSGVTRLYKDGIGAAYRTAKAAATAAIMKLPGKGWLELEVQGRSGGVTLSLTALFEPVGLFGQLYWYSLLPIHVAVWTGMLRGIARAAKARMATSVPSIAS